MEQALPDSSQVLDALDELQLLVRESAVQPLHQVAEGAVMHWLRVAEGKDHVQPRFSPVLDVPGTFIGGFERDPALRLERSVSEHRLERFEGLFEDRRKALGERLRGYFGRKGYRSSADQCDQTMAELEQLSRFLSAWMARVASEGPLPPLVPAPRPPRDSAPSEAEDEYAGFTAPRTPAARIRWHHLLWEPYLNEAIVTWEENTLAPYDAALEQMLGLLELPESMCGPYFMRPGHPLRPQGRRRMKVAVFSPVPRPLRNKSVFNVRFNQLARKIAEMGSAGSIDPDELTADIRYVIAMVRENLFQVASEPGFLTVSRPGVPAIRGRPMTHPFLLDTPGFFKQAIMFDNGTYTVGGGGIDAMFLQVRQLERFYRFQGGPHARRALAAIDACTIGWEENKWKVFTRGLLKIAECLKDAGSGA